MIVALTGLIILACFISVMVIVLYQPYKIYCLDNSRELASWCNEKIPNLYTFIQLKHWGVKFMGSYTLFNAVNVIIGMPMLLIHAWMIIDWIKKDFKGFFTLGYNKTNKD